ncbi:MAG: hypothetical protein ACI379_07620 [Nocardioides sp.]|uniref:hypothetical protein n=1 Tax=Nocardioides sp. TaxID=35761 RepID=UPI003F086AD3
MGWEQEMFALLDDLEGQASSLYAQERELELAERARAEYATVTLASRLVATLGEPVALDVHGLGRLVGTLQRAAADWCLLAVTSAGGALTTDWVVRLEQVTAVHGVSSRSVPEVAWGALSRLGVASAMRRLAEAQAHVSAHLVDGTRHEGVLGRVGQDFVELRGAGTETALLPFSALVALSSRES